MESAKKMRKSNIIFDWVIPIIIAFFISLAVRQFVLYKVYVPSESMMPTLNVGDQLFVTKIYNLNKIKRGDILVFKSEELDDTLIKRVIGLPGDTVSINNGVVSVNGQVLTENYVQNVSNNYGQFEVPNGKYFFLGDNRSDSWDSTKWSEPYIDGKCIEAKAFLKIYPFSDFGRIK